jgi:hypothetical protein
MFNYHIWVFIFLPPSHFLFVTPQLENRNSANKISKIDVFHYSLIICLVIVLPSKFKLTKYIPALRLALFN